MRLGFLLFIILSLGVHLSIATAEENGSKESKSSESSQTPQASQRSESTQATQTTSSSESSVGSPEVVSVKKKSKGRKPREKEAEGTKAPNRFDADTFIKSRYELNGQSLEVDTE